MACWFAQVSLVSSDSHCSLSGSGHFMASREDKGGGLPQGNKPAMALGRLPSECQKVFLPPVSLAVEEIMNQ